MSKFSELEGHVDQRIVNVLREMDRRITALESAPVEIPPVQPAELALVPLMGLAPAQIESSPATETGEGSEIT